MTMCDLLAEHEQNNKTTKKMKNRPDWPVFKKRFRNLTDPEYNIRFSSACKLAN